MQKTQKTKCKREMNKKKTNIAKYFGSLLFDFSVGYIFGFYTYLHALPWVPSVCLRLYIFFVQKTIRPCCITITCHRRTRTRRLLTPGRSTRMWAAVCPDYNNALWFLWRRCRRRRRYRIGYAERKIKIVE